jgi:hypothetical protein
MWLGLGVSGLTVLLCCGAGVVALVGLAVAGAEAVDEQSRVVVGDYLDAVRDKEYGKAYGLLCDSAQRRESPDDFERRVAAEPGIATYQIGEASVVNEVTVPVDVTYTGGGRETLRVFLSQDSGTGMLEVCGIS